MNRKSKSRAALSFAVVAGATLASNASAAIIGVSFNNYTNTLVTSNGARNAGFAFKVGAAGALVTQLDYYLNSGTSGQTSTTIRLYQSSGAYNSGTGTSTNIFTDTITTAGGTTPQGGTVSTISLTATPANITYYADTLAAPITLTQGTYYLAGDGATNAIVPYISASPNQITATNPTVDPLISYVGPVYANGVVQPNNQGGQVPAGAPGGFNVNLALTAVPEPASLGLVAVGASILLGRRHRR